MRRASLLFAVSLAACGPGAGAGTGTTGSTGTAASTTGASSGAPTTGIETTTSGAVTTAGTTGAASETGPAACAWSASDDFCPLLATANIDLAGMTPNGPISLRYAYFGRFLCFGCPDPRSPSLGLFAQEQTAGLDEFVGDYLRFDGLTDGPPTAMIEGEVAGELLFFDAVFADLELPTAEQMTPPYDPDVPPSISGSLEVVSEGWQLAGDFTATLCAGLDRTANCE